MEEVAMFQELKISIDALRNDSNHHFEALRNDSNHHFEALRDDSNHHFEALRNDVKALQGSLKTLEDRA
jgi:hypothetical protein